jgi:hypothetical protein
VVNRRKPHGLGAASTPISLMTWPPCHPGSTLVLRLNLETVPDFVLLFLPPCGPHLISFGHRVHRAKPTCLSIPRRPHMLRPFAPALHLHQRKSSRNLHLQYLAKSQSTPHCQSLITPRSDHAPVLGCSSPQKSSATPENERTDTQKTGCPASSPSSTRGSRSCSSTPSSPWALRPRPRLAL